MRAPVVAMLAGAMLLPNFAWSWGWTGHRAAARMAEQRLTPAALAAVRAILGPGVSLSDISTWADTQSEIPEGHRWHFVNIPLTSTGYDARLCPPVGCVVSKVEDFKRMLENPGMERRRKQLALKFLVHLVADLHQPLHVGDNGDRGGNLLQVRFFGVGANLHRVWDSLVMDRHTRNEGVWQWDLDFVATPLMVAEWSKGTPADWATESLQVAKQAYRHPVSGKMLGSGAGLRNEYYRFALTTIRMQLARSGIRIACILNNLK